MRIAKRNFKKQSQFSKGSHECKLIYNKGLQKKRCFRSPKNKANSKPVPSTSPLGASSGQALSSVEWANFRQEMPKMPCPPACDRIISALSGRPSLCRCLWAAGQWRLGRGRLFQLRCRFAANRQYAGCTIVR